MSIKNPFELKITPKFCSPSSSEKNYKHYKSCFSFSDLKVIARLINSVDRTFRIPDEMFSDAHKLYSAIDMYFKDTCGHGQDHCWIEQATIKSSYDAYSELSQRFRPKMKPTWKNNRYQWLDTYDIVNVMKQYEESHKNFTFLGAFPSDVLANHVCMKYQMCDFDLVRLHKLGKTQIGIVFNLDTDDKPGSHWVSVYINTNPKSKKYGVFYYDSIGKRPQQRHLNDFIKKMQMQVQGIHCKKQNAPSCKVLFNAQYNEVQHQYKNTECGVYSILFLIMCLERKQLSFRQICGLIRPRSDEDVNRMRSYMYRP